VLTRLAEITHQDRSTTAEMLTLIGIADARRLYAPKSCKSMFVYCVRRLRMSEDMAYKRIQVARAARKFPAILAMIADGRLHLTSVLRLAPYLTPENASELFEAATHRSKRELEKLLAERFTPPVPVPMVPSSQSLPARVGVPAAPAPSMLAEAATMPAQNLATGPSGITPLATDSNNRSMSCQLVPEPVVPPAPVSRVTMVAPGMFDVHFRFGMQAREKLHRAQELLSHSVPSGDLAQVFERALDEMIQKLEKRKFGAVSKPRPDARRRRGGEERECRRAGADRSRGGGQVEARPVEQASVSQPAIPGMVR